MSNEINIPTAPDMSDEKIFAQLGLLSKQFALVESSYKVIAKNLAKCQTLTQTCLALEKENPDALQPTYKLLLQAIEDLKDAATSAQALAQSNDGKLGLIQDNYRDFKKEYERDAKSQAEKAFETNNVVKTIAAVAPSAQTLLAAARGEPQRKPSNTISLADASRIMRRICPKHFVDERTLQRWVEKGVAAKSGLSITWANFATEDTWVAWCQKYNDSFAPPPDLLH